MIKLNVKKNLEGGAKADNNGSTANNNGPTANNYKQYDQRKHVYMKPDMYIGGDEKMERDEWVFDLEEKRMINKKIDFTPGCERLYLEILTNASDNVNRSRRSGVDPGLINIQMNNNEISITNYGLPIPIEIHPEEKVYVPQMIFGSLLTSSNYETDRHEAGTNGIGAKAANIFSKKFVVIVHDHINKLKYTQRWYDNMLVRDEPVIEQYNEKTSSVEVIYQMDFERFKYPQPNGNQGGYTNEAFQLFARHAIDISYTSKIKVQFNNESYNFSNIREYAKLYFGEVVDTGIVHYQWPKNTEVVKKKKGYQVAKDPCIVPEVELIAIDTPDDGYHVSFVNSMMTRDGGVHVNAAIKSVGDSAIKIINENVIKKLTKRNKGKDIDVKEKRSNTVNINDVKQHISLLLSVKVVNPKFTSQTKTILQSPTPKIDIPEEELNLMNKWKLFDRLYAALEAKQFANISKSDGKLNKHVKLKDGVDANNAGKADRLQCTLYITEGKSGAGYANELIGLIPNGRDYIGVLPMRGKSLNVMNADIFQIEQNKEIKELKKMLGLCEGINYMDDNFFNKLRYGRVMIMADSDVDGKHIIGLILNYFHCRFPSLLAREYVLYYRSPYLRVTHNRNTLKFYTPRQYDLWKSQTPDYKNWSHHYYKGLGTSKSSDVADDHKNPNIVNCYYDQYAPEKIRLAFDKTLADQRKDWIGRWQPLTDSGIDDIVKQPVSWFIDHELILFSIADIERSIPKLVDGFKESHRKTIHGAHLHWKISTKKSDYKLFKVAQLAAHVANVSKYHHGEVILGEVVVGMAQDFVGSNNLPWFSKGGQFGSRFMGGEDAAQTRYTFTKPEKLFPYILRKEDRPLLEYLIDEGENIEPKSYYPVIPMILVNGAHGIGTGYSTFIPCHDPLDIIKWLKLRLQNVTDADLPVIHPWYRNFKGIIKVFDRRHRKKKAHQNDDSLIVTTVNQISKTSQTIQTTESSVDFQTDLADIHDDDVESDYDASDSYDSRPLYSMVSYGNFYKKFDNTIVVDELPIGRWPSRYRKWLDTLIEQKKITDYRDLSNGDTVYFEISGFQEIPTYRTLKLISTKGMSNMFLLNDKNRPVRYDSANDILEAFYCCRLPVYQLRKNYIISNMNNEINHLTDKITFIKAVISKQIHVLNAKKSEIFQQMDALNISRDLIKTTISNCTEDEISFLQQQITDKELIRDRTENTSIQELWSQELNELESVYLSHFKLNTQPPKISIKLKIKH